MSREHVVDASQIHHDWDASREPVVAIESGDVVHFDLPITGEGQVRESSTVADVVWDFDTIYNLAGPVHVAGASRGDTLEIEILELTPGPWGWTTFIPGLGLLADDFPEPFLKIYDLRDGSTATVAPGVEVPTEPFLGTMGVPEDVPGPISPFPPHRGRRERRLQAPGRRLDVVAADLVRGCALLLRGCPCGAGRRRGLRQRHRVRDGGNAPSARAQAHHPGAGLPRPRARCRLRGRTTGRWGSTPT